MSDVATFRPQLERCFEERRIVLLQDTEAQRNGKLHVGERISF